MKKLEKDTIKEISGLMDELNLAELSYSDGKNDYKLRKHEKSNIVGNISHENYSPIVQEDKTITDNTIDKSVKAPLVGTVYLSPEPGAKPFVELDQTVKVGQVLLIIEAMKTMNEITAHKNGKVKKIFVKNSEPIEFGEPLILIE
jgi:acetyl-CoA carboxylase biotin carboxyl carrier protein